MKIQQELTAEDIRAIDTLVKRFEYQWIFRYRYDSFLDDFRKSRNPLYVPEPIVLHEFPVSAFLDSHKEAKNRFPHEMSTWYDFVRLERTGKKIRCFSLIMKIKWYAIKRKFIKWKN